MYEDVFKSDNSDEILTHILSKGLLYRLTDKCFCEDSHDNHYATENFKTYEDKLDETTFKRIK